MPARFVSELWMAFQAQGNGLSSGSPDVRGPRSHGFLRAYCENGHVLPPHWQDELVLFTGRERAHQGSKSVSKNVLQHFARSCSPFMTDGPGQIKAKISHVAFRDLIKHEPDRTWKAGDGLRALLGYGGPF